MIIFKFKTENDFKKAEDTMASDKFDHSIQPENKTITVSEKNAHIVEGWLNKHNLKFTLDRGFGKYAISDILRTAANNMAPKKVIKKTRIKECDYELCPHCGNEIGEKAIYQNEKGLYFHRVCGGAVEFPEYDYTKLSDIGLKLITPEQLEIRKRQLK